MFEQDLTQVKTDEDVEALPRFIMVFDESFIGLMNQLNSLVFVFKVVHIERDDEGFLALLDRQGTFVVTRADIYQEYLRSEQQRKEEEAALAERFKDIPLSA